EHLLNAFTFLHDAVAALQACRTRMDRIDQLGQPKKPAAHTSPICAEPHCADDAAPGRDGRCEPCDKWRRRWADKRGRSKVEAPIVPKSVIDDRVNLRENRKVHVNGPLSVSQP